MLHLDAQHEMLLGVAQNGDERNKKVLHARCFLLSLILVLCAFAPGSAQARALIVFGQAGRMFPILNVSDAGDDMSPGAAFGGGIGLQVGPTTAIRGSVSISKSHYRGTTLALNQPGVTSALYGFDLMFGTPSDAGLAPYIFFGGGRITSDPAEPDVDSVNKLAGRIGTGINYVPDNSFFVLFVEACGWLYEFELFGFNELQFNPSLQGGLAFAVPF